MMATDDKIRVLIVDDIAETRENIKKLLQFESDIEVIGGARTGQEGVEMARKHQPHVVLMDINMPDMDGIEATQLIVSDVPRAQIVMLSVQNEPDYMRKAMVAGARDFLTKPPSADELIATIRRMHTQWKARTVSAVTPAVGQGTVAGAVAEGGAAAGHILTVYSPKGGTGCTTVATNLALSLRRASKDGRVLLIDGDLQFGDIGVFLNLDNKFTIVDVTKSPDSLDNDFLGNVLIAHESGLRVLLAPNRPEEAEMVDAENLREALQIFRRLFDYIVIDTASAVNDVNLTFFDVSDRVLLVTTPDIPAIAGARKFFELASVIDFPEQNVVFVVNRVDKRGITPKDIGDSIKHEVRGQIPFEHYAVLASINRGVPIMLSPKANPVGEGVYRLTRTLMTSLTESANQETAGSDSRRSKRSLFGS